jgi:ABC-type multidrug transport system fused ATPase/permease subunit
MTLQNSSASPGFIFTTRAALGLLSGPNRKRFWALSVAQMAIGILDVVGATLLAFVVFLFSASMKSNSPEPALIAKVHEFQFLKGYSLIGLAIIIAAAATLFFLLKSIICLLLIRKNLKFLGEKQAEIVADLLEKFFKKNLLFVENRSPQKVSQELIKGTSYLTVELLGPLSIALSEATLLLLFTILLAWISPTLMLGAVILFGGVGLFLQRFLGHRAAAVGEIETSAISQGSREIQESIASFRSIATFSREKYFVNSVVSIVQRGSVALSRRKFMEQIPKFAFEVVLIIGVLALGLSQLGTSDITNTSTTLVLFLTAILRSTPSMLRLQNAFFSIKHATGQAKTTLDFIETLSQEPNRHSRLDSSEEFPSLIFEGRVEFKDVSFSYPNQKAQAVTKITFSVEPGKSLAIVGKSGAGKSTIMDLILGLLTPSEGEVLLDNRPVQECMQFWKDKISYVPQHAIVVSKSICENVALGINLDLIDEKLVWKTLEDVKLADYVRSLPFGLKTSLGSGGVSLSGGERQRLGLSRAFYFDPKLLLLDEATSALDPETEQFISETLESFSGRTTRILVAHRLGTVQNADYVLYLEGGECQAFGTFSEVKEKSPNFERHAKLLGL